MPRKGIAISAFIVGSVAFLIGWIPFLGFIAGAGAVALGIVALVQKQVRWMSITGLCLGAVAALTSLVITIVLFTGDWDEVDSGTAADASESSVSTPTPTPEPSAEPKSKSKVEDSGEATKSPEKEERPEKQGQKPASDAYGGYTSQQKGFVETAKTHQDQWDSAKTELQQSEAIRQRDAALCAAVPGSNVEGWVGKIIEIGANKEGKAHVRIEIAENMVVQTWNNSFSDLSDNTLIDPSSPVFASLTPMEEGKLVRFSGSFIGAGDSCLQGANLSDTFYAIDPNWIMTFSSIQPQ